MRTLPATDVDTVEKDKGFTLIELLVVVVIIGILAAIAIPLFLSQREKAAESSLKSDLRNAASVMETAYVDDQAYNGTNAPAADGTDFEISNNNTLAVSSADAEKYCIDGTSTGTDAVWHYDSNAGGLAEGACS